MEHVLTHANAQGGGGGSLLMAAVGAFRALAGSRSLSTEEQRIKAAIEGAASAIGAPLLDATSLDDFSRRLDAIVENKDLAVHFRQLARVLTTDDALIERFSATAQGSPEWVIDILGEDQRALVDDADRVMQATAEALENLRRTLRFTLSLDLSQPVLWSDDNPLAFLTARDVHPRIASILVGTYYANVCFLAIISAGITDRKPAPWLARAIAERWVQGLTGQLILMASFPGTHVAEDLVARGQRLDLEALERENAEANTAMEQFHRDADEAGVDVYVPDSPR